MGISSYSVKLVRYQLKNVVDALNKLSDAVTKPTIKAEAILIKKNLLTYEIILSLVIWYDVLYAVNTVSKLLQAEDVNLDVTLNEVTS